MILKTGVFISSISLKLKKKHHFAFPIEEVCHKHQAVLICPLESNTALNISLS